MAAIDPPLPTYTPNLPKAVISQGLLSLPQLEAVVYAGQAHQQFMSNGERRDFFIGDSVGMGREIAGIMRARNLPRRRWQGDLQQAQPHQGVMATATRSSSRLMNSLHWRKLVRASALRVARQRSWRLRGGTEQLGTQSDQAAIGVGDLRNAVRPRR